MNRRFFLALFPGLPLLGLFAFNNKPLAQTGEAIEDKSSGVADKSGLDAQEGVASHYADSLHGEKTASGGTYDKNAFSAAHRSIPFGTKIKVTYLETGRSVIVLVNDRGPFVEDRIIDISGAAAKKIGLTETGHGKVRIEIIEP